MYPFGHGLSYTSFAYENLRTVGQADLDRGHSAAAQAVVRLALDVRNVGKRTGDEVVQVYVRAPNSKVARPVLELRDFRRLTLSAGEVKTVEFSLPRRAFEHYDAGRHLWTMEPGTYEVLVGASSQDIRGKVAIILE